MVREKESVEYVVSASLDQYFDTLLTQDLESPSLKFMIIMLWTITRGHTSVVRLANLKFTKSVQTVDAA